MRSLSIACRTPRSDGGRFRFSSNPASETLRTRHATWPVFRGDHFDRRVATFGLVSSLSKSTALRAIASSV